MRKGVKGNSEIRALSSLEQEAAQLTLWEAPADTEKDDDAPDATQLYLQEIGYNLIYAINNHITQMEVCENQLN